MKITHSKKKITPFGGFNFCHELLSDTGIPNLIDNHLGQRVKYAGFNYSEILSNHLAIFLNGGDCAEDINEHLRSNLKQVRGLSVCSADTILRGIKELSTPIEEYVSDSGVKHYFNINTNLNKLLVKALVKTGQLDNGTGYTLDYDNQVIATEKYDAMKTYKKCEGYQPGVASIGEHIVYIEGRNGNSQAKYQQAETLERTFCLLSEQEIKVKRFRADSASYQQKVIDLVTEQCHYFYIRAMRCTHMEQLIGQLPADAWEKVRLGVQEMEVAEIKEYRPFDGKKAYRLVVSRIKRRDKQTGLFTGDDYTYRAIITNDDQWDNKQIVSFYNQRGSAERTFDAMNNDFGWSKLPCSFLNENTTFMILTALYANLYHFILSSFSKKLSWLKENFRLKKFIFRFITVAATWIKTGRQYVLKLYTDKDYSPLTG
jgi:hypothetical protein